MTFDRTVILAARGIAKGDKVQRIQGRIVDQPTGQVDFEPAEVVDSIEYAHSGTDFFGGEEKYYSLSIGGKPYIVRGDVDVYTVPSR